MIATMLLALFIDVALLIKVIVGLFIFFSWLANKATGTKGKAPPPLQRPVPQNRPPANPTVQNQIEEFVRQMQNRQTRPTPKATMPDAPTAQRSKPTPAPASKPSRKSLPPSQPAPAKAPAGKAESVAEHVTKRMDDQAFVLRAEHLVDDIKDVDEAREEHLREVFSHKLGKLQDTSGGPVNASDSAGAAPQVSGEKVRTLFPSLASAAGLREAFILREIFDVPTSRWE